MDTVKKEFMKIYAQIPTELYFRLIELKMFSSGWDSWLASAIEDKIRAEEEIRKSMIAGDTHD